MPSRQTDAAIGPDPSSPTASEGAVTDDADDPRRGDLSRDLSRDPSTDPCSQYRDEVGTSADRRRDPADDLTDDLADDLAGDRQNDLAADDHEQDASEQEDEIWFEAETLAAASRVELGQGPSPRPTSLRSASFDRLRHAAAAGGVTLASLPGWPDAGASGQGLGPILDDLIGALRPGDLGLLTAHRRGAGRSSLLAQLADGLALRRAPTATPVLAAIDETPEHWRARSLARWSGLDVRRFTGAAPDPRGAAVLDQFAASEWAALDRRQRFVDPRELVDAEARPRLLAGLHRWRAELAQAQGVRAEAVWPVLILDPLEHLDAAVPQTLAWLATLARDEGLLILASADAPDPADMAATRAFDRELTLRLLLEPTVALTVEDGSDGSPRTLTLTVVHRRLGPGGAGRLRWDPASGRFEPG